MSSCQPLSRARYGLLPLYMRTCSKDLQNGRYL